MSSNNPIQPGCSIKWSQKLPPPTATAKPGPLRLTLVPISNLVFFIPAACSVSDDAGTNVPLTTATPTGISFTAVSGKTYTLSVSYLTAPPAHPASAKLQEDCKAATGGITVDQTTGAADYTFEVN